MDKIKDDDEEHRHYLELRRRVETEAKAIHCVASTLSAFQQCDRDTVKIDPMAMGVLHEIIVGRVLAIYEALDEASPEPVLNPPP